MIRGNKIIKQCFLLRLMLLLTSAQAFAAYLSVIPSVKNVGISETAYVDIVLGG